MHVIFIYDVHDMIYMMNGMLHVSVPIGPSSGFLMNQVSNAAYMLGSQYVYNWFSLISKMNM
jgi:hypothetical protein